MSDLAEYSPQAIRYWISNWSVLVSACEGGTGNSGVGSGRGGRFSLVCLKADLERAADQLPIYWQTTGFIFRRQRRWATYVQWFRTAPEPIEPQYEPPIPSDALEQACYRMALYLGWRPEEEQVA